TGTLAATGPTLTLNSPNGGESLHGLEPFPIMWSSTMSTLANIRLEYKVGNSRFLITSSTPNNGSFNWAPPSLSSSAYTVVVSEAADLVPRDSSDATFSVCAPIEEPGSYGPTVAPSSGELADFNRDGILDLIVTTTTGVAIEPGTGTAGVGDGG